MNEQQISEMLDVESEPLHLGKADVDIEHAHGRVSISIRSQGGTYLALTLPMGRFREAMTGIPAEDPWWDIRYRDSKKMCEALIPWKCRALDIEAARDKWAEECPGDELVEIWKSDLEPWSDWIPKADGAKYPHHAMRLFKAEGGKVEFAPAGGGMQMSGALSQFLDEFTIVTEEMKNSGRHDIALFDFDEGAGIVGFSTGQRWNGWGVPYLEVESFTAWIADDPTGLFEVVDGVVSRKLQEGEEGEDEVLKPFPIDYWGVEYLVVDASCGLVWNQYDPGGDADYIADKLGSGETCAPEGLDLAHLTKIVKLK